MTKIRKLLAITITFAALLAAALLAAGWHFSSALMRPPYRCHEAYVYCKGPSEPGLPFRDVGITASDGVKLSGWFIPREGSDRIVVFVHGHGGNRYAGLRYAAALHRAGFNYLLCDLRGNMKDPEKSFFSMGFHEQKDTAAMIDYAAGELRMRSIGIMGFSMGASTAITSMARDGRIRAGIFNSGFSGVREQLADRAWARFRIPAFPLVDIILGITSLRGGIDFGSVSPLAHIGKIAPRPVFIIHSRMDNEIGFGHARRLYGAAGNPKMLWHVMQPGHVMEWNNDRNMAEKMVTDFFAKHL